jgi:hypothetical protein
MFMKDYRINAQQIQGLLQLLGEFPAKQVIAGIDLLRNLPEVLEEKKGE